jgi:hypothetical protein
MQPPLKLGVEISRRAEAAAGQEGAFQIIVQPLDAALGLRSAGLQMITFTPSTPRNP